MGKLRTALIQLFCVIVAYSLTFVLPNTLIDSPTEAQNITAGILPILLIAIFIFIRKFGFIQLCGLAYKKNHLTDSKDTRILFLGVLLIPLSNIVSAVLSGTSEFASVALFVILISGAIIEELIFRGYVIGIMLDRGWTPHKTVLFSSILFACLHLFNVGSVGILTTIMQTLASFSLGAVFAIMRFTSKTIYPAIMAHLLINATSARSLLYDGTVLWISCVLALILGLCSILWWLRHTTHVRRVK